jgi:hypothetical protein
VTATEDDQAVTTSQDLPFVDDYSRSVAAPVERTWAALQEYVDNLVSTAPHPLLWRVLGTVPQTGFEIVDNAAPHQVVLGGRHRFSTYRLVFRNEPEGEGSRLHAVTYAEFPGLRGRAYRTMLMVSTGHRRAAERMLRTVARHAEA